MVLSINLPLCPFGFKKNKVWVKVLILKRKGTLGKKVNIQSIKENDRIFNQ